MFITIISLSPDIHKRLMHLAVDSEVPFGDLIREAIEEDLARKAKGSGKK